MDDEYWEKYWEFFRCFYRETCTTGEHDHREGQAHMNALRYVDPELYCMLTGTLYDCFYLDERVGAYRDLLGI